MKTQKLLLSSIALVSALVAGTTSGLAQAVTVSQIPGYSADAGEFNLTPIVGSGYGAAAIVNNGFESFCISRAAGIELPGTYYDFVSANGVYLPDNLTISKGTAYLYSQFAGGTLTGYHYAGAGIIDPAHILSERAEDAYQLQLAFWTLEGQYWYGPSPGPLSASQDLANPWLALVANNFGGGTNGLIAAMAANTPGGLNVGVLNLNKINPDLSVGGTVQPVLVLLGCVAPDSTITAPISVLVNTTNNSACAPDAGAGATYVWTIINGSITAGQGTTCITWTAGGSGTTTLGVTVTTAAGCRAVGSKVVSLTPPPPVNLGRGDTATIGFWHNKNGQALINSMPNSPALANWLANNFPCLYGANAGANNLTGKSDTEVAAFFMTFFNVKGQKTDAQVLGTALACYVTSSVLAGNNAASYGFNVSPLGTGAKTYNVGAYGLAIGLANNTSYTVLQLLQQANLRKCQGTFDANAFNNIFDGINTTGDIL